MTSAVAPLPELGQMHTAKLVLLGEMGAGKSSLVLRFVKGQFFDYQAREGRREREDRKLFRTSRPSHASHKQPTNTQASTVGAAFLTKTLPELNVKFEIW